MVDTQIWRYVDLAKLLHLLGTETLHFTRLDQFNDQFEGSFPVQNIQDWEYKHPKVGDFSHWRKYICVSCWYESPCESSSMWMLYGGNLNGVSIQSTKGRLEESLASSSLAFESVEYIDYVKNKADIFFPHHVFKYKRKEFASEKEYRAAILGLPKSEGCNNGVPECGSVEAQGKYPKVGIDIPIDLDVLIEKIVLSPYSEPWFKKTIAEVLMRFGISDLILRESELARDPIYPKQ